MRYGLLSGLLWGLDTVLLSLAYSSGALASDMSTSLVVAALHDTVCALAMFFLMLALGRLSDVAAALKTRNGRVIMLGALIGGPIGMSAYLLAISLIGPGYTAVISAFYPAVGSVLAWLFLSERLTLIQILALIVALGAVMVMGWFTATEATMTNPLYGVIAALVCVCGWGSEAVILAWGMSDSIDNKVALHIRQTTSAVAYLFIVIPCLGAFNLLISTALHPSSIYILCAGVAGVVSYLFYYKAISLIGAARAMAANISYSAWAVIFAAVLAHVMPTTFEVVCCFLIAVGTVLSSAQISDLVDN